MKLVVGLGNPGSKYDGTRHNIGFQVLEKLFQDDTPQALSKKLRKYFGWNQNKRNQAETHTMFINAIEVILAKPQTYMNLSGEAVQSLMTVHRIKPEEVLVVCDDWELPVGQTRMRRSGGAGGHNGLASVIGKIGDGFSRLRVGIGKPPADVPGERYVLERCSAEELAKLAEASARAAEAVKTWVGEGVEAAMNRYNVALPSLSPLPGRDQRESQREPRMGLGGGMGEGGDTGPIARDRPPSVKR